jgi:hypothetical protein
MRGIKLIKYRFDKFVFGFQEASLRSCKIFASVLVRFDYHDANYLFFVHLACIVILLRNNFEMASSSIRL